MNYRRTLNLLMSPLSSYNRPFDVATRGSLFVFNYHEVSDEPSQFSRDFNLNVPPDIFVRQLGWIQKFFNVIEPSQLTSGNFDLPAALVTFDDGFRSAFREGGPLLLSAGVPATMFMNMAPVAGEPFWSGVVTYLTRYSPEFNDFISNRLHRPVAQDFFLYCTEKDVSDFCAAGYSEQIDQARAYYGAFAEESDLARSASQGIFLGNHLFNHYNAATLTLETLRQQYLLNESAMAKYPNRVRMFSYPFGQPVSCYNHTTDSELFSLGAERIFTAFPLPNRLPTAPRLHRVSMFSDVDSEATFKANCVLPAFINSVWRKSRHAYV